MNLICLDAEFADAREILELAVYSFNEQLLFHSLFKPRNIRRWPSSERIHHISPKMVSDKPSFDSCRHDIQKVIDSADYVVGFAIDNDIRMLERSGIEGFDNRTIVDVRDIYWHCVARDRGVSLNSVPGLAACAESLNVPFAKDEEHSAGGDTLVTLRCLRAMMDMDSAGDSEAMPRTRLDKLIADTDADKRQFRRENAKGYIHLLLGPKGYSLKTTAGEHLARPDVVATVPVMHRDKAEVELLNHFSKKAVRGEHRIFTLRDRDIAFFKAYTCEYDEENYDLYRTYSRKF